MRLANSQSDKEIDYSNIIDASLAAGQQALEYPFASYKERAEEKETEYRKNREFLFELLGTVAAEMTKATDALKAKIPGLAVIPEIVGDIDAGSVDYVFNLAGKTCIAHIRPHEMEKGQTHIAGPDELCAFIHYDLNGSASTRDLTHPAIAIAGWVSEKLTRAAYGQLIS